MPVNLRRRGMEVPSGMIVRFALNNFYLLQQCGKPEPDSALDIILVFCALNPYGELQELYILKSL